LIKCSQVVLFAIVIC